MTTDNANQDGQGAQQPEEQQRPVPPPAAIQPPPGSDAGANGRNGNGRNKDITFLEGVGKIILANLGPILTVVVILVGIIGVGYMIHGNDPSHDIRTIEYARGIITVLFSVGTIAIALVLILSAIFLNDPEKKDRFDRGKEVLSLLLGIFGTIIGFYYGANQKPAPDQSSTGTATTPATLPAQIAPGAINPEQAKKSEMAKKAQDVPAADPQHPIEPQKRTN